MVVITAVLVADVFGRYVMNSPIMWAPQVAVFSFVWLVYLGAVDVSINRGHIAVDVFTEMLPVRIRAAVASLVQLMTVAVLTYLAWFGFQYFVDGNFTSLPGLGISKRFMELAIPISATGMGTVAVLDLIAAIRGVMTGVYESSEAIEEFDDDATDQAFSDEMKKVMDS